MPQHQHAMLPQSNHDERARQAYVADLRFNLLNEVGPGMKTVYDQRVKPAFQQANGRVPKDKHEVHAAMMKDHYARTWSSLMRSCQEMMWGAVTGTIERQFSTLTQRALEATSEFSSLELDDSITVPSYLDAVDIHCMPGNYHTDRCEGDAAQGALYDNGVYVYQMGFAGEFCDGIGRSVAEFIRRRYPDFHPKRILDVGCTVGHNTAPFCEVFPEAEVIAVDCCAPVLRYGHARAESLELPVHFRQMDARELNFEDESFDLVTSCILFHETDQASHVKILQECERVLKPGGLTVHMELPPNSELDPYQGFQIDWDAHYNNEPHYQRNSSLDPRTVMAAAGFQADEYFEWLIPDLYFASAEQFEAGVNAATHSYDETGRWGEVARWYGYGAWK
jgi:ubiquinone/menaquinone biosynthesis C-methylase UbiE